MNKIILVLFATSIILGACKTNNARMVDNQPRKRITSANENFYSRDSFFLGEGPSVYSVSTLYKGNRLIDTILNGFGWDTVGQRNIVYSRIHAVNETTWTESRDSIIEIYGFFAKGGICLFDGIKRTNISKNMPLYNDFSSPAYKDGCIYYWGLKKNIGDRYLIYALRFDIKQSHADSLLLFETELGTDDEDYFYAPILENGKILFLNYHDSVKWEIKENFSKFEKKAI